jgi:hypothetical protein
MQRRAKFIMSGLAVLSILAMGRYGMIDSQRASAWSGGSAQSPSPARPALLVASTADSDVEAVRDWLRQQVGGQSVLMPGPGLDLLAELDEDPRDRGRVRLMPSGRSVPKVQGGDDERWTDGLLWPAARGLGDEQSAASLDLHNIRAVEPDLEERRNSRDYGEGGDSLALEPGDGVKGDVARTLFYMSLRYDGRDGGAQLRLVVRPAEPGEPAVGGLCTLLAWNERDAVDSGELRRNDRVERYQGNRNPFVDRPEFARVLWGRACPGRGPTS